MTERCKPIMTLLMIAMASLMICQTEGTRTSKQLFLTPYHLANGPIVPHLPYWTPYYYPMSLGHLSPYGQPFIDNTQFIENQTGDSDLTSLIEQNPDEAMSRQRPFLTFLQNLFFGGPPTACPSCPSCPANKPCAPCAVTTEAAKVGTFTTCEANGFSFANTGTITLLAAALPTAKVCNYWIAAQVPVANIRVTCPTAPDLGGVGVATGVTVHAMNELTTAGTNVLAGNNGITPLSNFVAIKFTNAKLGGSATCSWDFGLTAATAQTACDINGVLFFAASTGTITIPTTTLTNARTCSYNVASVNPAATITIKCTEKDLNGPITPGDVTASFENALPVSVTTTGVTVSSNYVTIKINNQKTNGKATCDWTINIPP